MNIAKELSKATKFQKRHSKKFPDLRDIIVPGYEILRANYETLAFGTPDSDFNSEYPALIHAHWPSAQKITASSPDKGTQPQLQQYFLPRQQIVVQQIGSMTNGNRQNSITLLFSYLPHEKTSQLSVNISQKLDKAGTGLPYTLTAQIEIPHYAPRAPTLKRFYEYFKGQAIMDPIPFMLEAAKYSSLLTLKRQIIEADDKETQTFNMDENGRPTGAIERVTTESSSIGSNNILGTKASTLTQKTTIDRFLEIEGFIDALGKTKTLSPSEIKFNTLNHYLKNHLKIK